MEEFKSNVSEKETEEKVEQIKSDRPVRTPGTIYAEPLKAEGNEGLKRVINTKIESQIAQADEKEEGVRIQFSDSQFGREVYEEMVEGFNGQKRTKVIDILIHKGTSVHRYNEELAKKMIKFFGKRAKIVG